MLSEDFETKLCDFGHSRPRARTLEGGYEKKVAFYGTRDMTAPELVGNLKNKYSASLLERYSGFEADVWFVLNQSN